jgi:hypothetical protein
MIRFKWTADIETQAGRLHGALRHAQPPLIQHYLCSSVAKYFSVLFVNLVFRVLHVSRQELGT